jgi:hypothetical protein
MCEIQIDIIGCTYIKLRQLWKVEKKVAFSTSYKDAKNVNPWGDLKGPLYEMKHMKTND